jgi:hypothetical protein
VNKIKVGFFSITEADDDEAHVAWHQLDHMCEQFRIPGLSWGQRFFATPACVEASAHRSGPMGAATHLQHYLLERASALADFTALGHELVGNGRFRPTTVAHLQAPFQLVETLATPRVLVTPESLAYRPNHGVYLVVERVVDPARIAAWRREQHATHVARLLTVPGVAGMWSYTAEPLPHLEPGPYGIPASPNQIAVLYLDGDPVAASEALRAHLTARWDDAPVEPLLAGAFRSFFPPPAQWCVSDDEWAARASEVI